MRIDRRWIIAREFCGHPESRFVARFCGDWLGQSQTRKGAREIAEAHRAKFYGDLGLDVPKDRRISNG